MKLFLLVALFAVAVAANTADDETHINGENGWYVPQIDGSFVWASKEDAESKLNELEQQEMIEGRLSTSPVTFYLYTRASRDKPIKITETAKSVSAAHFDGRHPTRFAIHGWTGSYSDDMNKDIADAWLDAGEHNVIIVDWGRARSVDYASSVVAVPGVGKKVASMVNYLVRSHGMSLETLHVIGHSLGAHVAGYTGKNVKGEVHTIVGLDPALPLFSYDKPDKRLSSTDAFYVESIQTNGGKLGFLKPIGKGAFYPNGGKSQPGCGVDVTGGCSHGRSVIYYVEAVRENNFPTMKCSDYEEAVKKSCGSSYSSVRMGATSNAYMVAGDFYVPVKSTAPYGMGH